MPTFDIDTDIPDLVELAKEWNREKVPTSVWKTGVERFLTFLVKKTVAYQSAYTDLSEAKENLERFQKEIDSYLQGVSLD